MVKWFGSYYAGLIDCLSAPYQQVRFTSRRHDSPASERGQIGLNSNCGYSLLEAKTLAEALIMPRNARLWDAVGLSKSPRRLLCSDYSAFSVSTDRT